MPAAFLFQRNIASPAQADLVNRLLGTGRPAGLVAAGAPYDVGRVQPSANLRAALAAYSYAPASYAAVASVLAGESRVHLIVYHLGLCSRQLWTNFSIVNGLPCPECQFPDSSFSWH